MSVVHGGNLEKLAADRSADWAAPAVPILS